MDVYLLLENEVIRGCIDISIVAVQDYLEDEKVKTLIASPSRTCFQHLFD